MGTEITIFVNGEFNTKIHTSCSQPIYPGLVFGDFTVVSGSSRNGGNLVECPPQITCDPCDRSAGKKAVSSESEPFALSRNYPNPFNPVTTINFSLPNSSYVTLNIYNVLGEKITTLVDREFSAGIHSVEWNAREFSSGFYFYRIEAGSFTKTNRMMLIK